MRDGQRFCPHPATNQSRTASALPAQTPGSPRLPRHSLFLALERKRRPADGGPRLLGDKPSGKFRCCRRRPLHAWNPANAPVGSGSMTLAEQMTQLARQAKAASRVLAGLSTAEKNFCLLAMADALIQGRA